MSLLDALDGAHKKLLRPSGGCHKCPRKKIDFVPPTLLKTQAIVVGEAPGETEAETGEGFSGKSGELLYRFARAANVPEFSKTNVLHCRPPANATPKPKELECCLAQYVLDEIRGYPIVILAGSTPLTALYPGARADHFRGNLAYHPDFPGQRFYTIYHPAYILRNPYLEDEFRRQLERLARIMHGEPPQPWTIWKPHQPEFRTHLRDALARRLLSFDFESNDVDTWKPSTIARSLALTADGKNVLFVDKDSSAWREVMQALRVYLEQEANSVLGSNVAFDLDLAEHEMDFIVKVTGIHELQVLYYQWKQYKMASLKELVAREADGYRHLVYDPTTETNMEYLSSYNAEDVVYPIQLFWQAIKAIGPKTRDLVTRVLGPASLVLRQITTTGFHFRKDFCKQKIDEYTEKRRQKILEWKDLDPEFIPTVHESGNGLITYLFEMRKLPVLARTEESNEPSTDQLAIRQWIKDGATYLQPLLDIREIDKLLSTYFVGYSKHAGADSRVHSNYTLTYTDTGRSSSREPNVQNPARVKDVRNLFGCTPGGSLIESDLSQIEFRIMGCLAEDETAIQGYLRGEDAHTTTAKNFSPNPTKEERNRAKPINFSLIYGGSWENVQRVALNDYGLDWSEELCRKFTDIFFATYTRFPVFHEASRIKLINNKGWFESIVGHTWHYRDWNHPENGKRDHCFRSALNSEAQGPAAQICFAIQVFARRLFDKHKIRHVHFVNTVHDSILTDNQPGSKVSNEDVIAIMEEAVATAYEWVKPWFIVPLLMDHKTGETWGDLVDYKK